MGKQFQDVSSRYGSPMGRRVNMPNNKNEAIRCRLYRVRLDSGGYDDGGAYWGIGTPLYCLDGDFSDYHTQDFIRSYSRNEAKEHFLAKYPNITFYR